MGAVQLTPPWGFSVPKFPWPHLHIVMRGREWYTLEGADVPPLELTEGDVVLLPRGDAHALQDDLRRPLESFQKLMSSVPEWHLRTPHAAPNEFMGIACELSAHERNPLLDVLPDIIYCRASDPEADRWVRPTVELLEAEYRDMASGSAAIIIRLVETVFMHAIRVWLKRLPADSRGWLRALQDARVAAALRAIHADASERWTVKSLAVRAGMSRTAFASRFRTLVEETPMQYVARWRMQRAADMLEKEDLPLKVVTSASGFSSEAAFRLAFRKCNGTLPSLYRHQHRRPSPGSLRKQL